MAGKAKIEKRGGRKVDFTPGNDSEKEAELKRKIGVLATELYRARLEKNAAGAIERKKEAELTKLYEQAGFKDKLMIDPPAVEEGQDALPPLCVYEKKSKKEVIDPKKLMEVISKTDFLKVISVSKTKVESVCGKTIVGKTSKTETTSKVVVETAGK